MTLVSVESSTEIHVPPLTRNGYERLPEVEAQIRECLRLPRHKLLARVQLRDKTHAHFVEEETLVFLTRDARLKGDNDAAERLSAVLVRRIVEPIRQWLREVGLRHEVNADAAAEAAQEVIARVFSGGPNRERVREGGILDLGSDKSDYAQVRFWDFLKARVIDVGRAAGVRRRRDERGVELTSVAGHNDGDDEAPSAFNAFDEWDNINPQRPLTEEALREAIRELPNEPLPLRDVARLYCFEKWEIGHGDTEDVTLASHFKRSPKTIKTWLQKAEQLLRETL